LKKLLSIFLVFILALLPFSVFAETDPDSFDMAVVNEIMKNTDIFNLKARSAILIDAKTGMVLYEKNADDRLPIASITKIMTSVIVMDHIKEGKLNYDDMVTVSEYAYSMGGSQVYLEPGEKFTVRELIEAVEIHSANDAAVALAEKIAGSEDAFVLMMNNRAKELGLKDTVFKDCTGLTDEGHYSTAREIAKFSAELINKHPEILEITTTQYKEFRPGPNYIAMWNRNRLIWFYNGANGLKTGFTTAAGYCLVGSAKREDLQLISVVLGEPNNNTRFAETAKLLDYGFYNFESVDIIKKDDYVKTVEVKKGVKDSVDLIYADDFSYLIDKSKKDKLKIDIVTQDTLTAPVEKGTIIGYARITLDKEVIGNVNILTADTVEKASFFRLFIMMIKEWLTFK
jgi:D-alanyl-D-alanine carboxypeptidase (penicillin-binding protein 5/6)